MITFKLLDKEQSVYYIDKMDDYLRSVNAFYLSKIIDPPYNLDNFKDALRYSCRSFTADAKLKFINKEKDFNIQLEKLGFNIDLTVYLIATNGSDNIGLPYTKDRAIILPVCFNNSEQSDQTINFPLLVHEVFHILSRLYPDMRKSAYEALGFQKLGDNINLVPLEYQKELFINPDALDYSFAFPFQHKGIDLYAAPFLHEDLTNSVAAVYDKKLRLAKVVPLNSIPYYRNAFQNTGYNNHPEELSAEHFRLLFSKSEPPDNKILSKFYESIKPHFI